MSTRKGISPLIAAVLIIAFTMAIAGMFSEWSIELVDGSTDDAGDHQDEILDCSGNNIEFLEIDYNEADEELEVMLQATGGNLGETLVTVYPSVEQNTTEELTSDTAIDTVTVDLEDVDVEEQNSVAAQSIPCDVTTEEDLDL